MAEPKCKFSFCSFNSWVVSVGSSSCYSLYIFLQTAEMTGCLHVLVLHGSDMNLLIDKRRNWKFCGWQQLWKFTRLRITTTEKHTLQFVLACNLPGTPKYRVFCGHSILDQILRTTQCTEKWHCGFIKGPLGNLTCIWVQRGILLEIWS